MEILDLSKQHLQRIIDLLRDGSVVVYPTETSYGLGGNALSTAAIERVACIKGRDAHKPLPVICADINMVERIAMIPEFCRPLMEQYWPGPLTLVLTSRGVVPPSLISGLDAIAVRVSGSAVARQLSYGLDAPLISTSANRSGQPDIYTQSDLENVFSTGEQPDAALLHGDLPKRQPTTIIDATSDRLKVLRQGEVVLNLE